FPYRYGQALWAYIGGRGGDSIITNVYRAALAVGFEGALRRVLGEGSDSLSKGWLRALRETHTPPISGRAKPRVGGRTMLAQKRISGDMNLSPTLSPDGKYVAFLARREIFTIDLFVADAQTGEVIKKLTSPNVDNHLDAISYVQSAGA